MIQIVYFWWGRLPSFYQIVEIFTKVVVSQTDLKGITAGSTGYNIVLFCGTKQNGVGEEVLRRGFKDHVLVYRMR